MFDSFPHLFEGFGDPAAAFGKACIANLSARHKHQSGGFPYRFFYQRAGLPGNSLVSLAMVVGANIKKCVIFAVPPTNVLLIRLKDGLVFSLPVQSTTNAK